MFTCNTVIYWFHDNNPSVFCLLQALKKKKILACRLKPYNISSVKTIPLARVFFHFYIAVNATSYFTTSYFRACRWTCTQRPHQISESYSCLWRLFLLCIKVTVMFRLQRIYLGATSFSRHQFLSQSVIYSVTLFKQSDSLSKHFNPPTSSLFPGMLASVCHGTPGSSRCTHNVHAEP